MAKPTHEICKRVGFAREILVQILFYQGLSALRVEGSASSVESTKGKKNVKMYFTCSFTVGEVTTYLLSPYISRMSKMFLVVIDINVR